MSLLFLYDYLADLEKIKDVRRARFDGIQRFAPFFANDKPDSLSSLMFVKFAEKRRADAGPLDTADWTRNQCCE